MDKHKTPRGKRSKTPGLGIPRVLAAIRHEKINEVVPVRLQLSLKNYIKRQARKEGVSAWIRAAVIEKLILEERKREE